MRYIVDIGVPFEHRSDAKFESIAALYGGYCESSGAGFGLRDMQFVVKSKQSARELSKALLGSLPAGGLGEGYCSFSYEPSSPWYFLYVHDWREFWDYARSPQEWKIVMRLQNRKR